MDKKRRHTAIAFVFDYINYLIPNFCHAKTIIVSRKGLLVIVHRIITNAILRNIVNLPLRFRFQIVFITTIKAVFFNYA